MQLKKSAGFRAIPGQGIEVVIDDNITLLGNKKFMDESSVSVLINALRLKGFKPLR